MDTSSTSLLNTFADFGMPEARQGGFTKVDPKEQFVKACKADIASLKVGDLKGKMFKPRKVGTGIAVTLRNGIRVIEIVPGRPDFNVQDAEKAIALLEHAKSACERGELDTIFAEHARQKAAE